jgi:hypothetical protein
VSVSEGNSRIVEKSEGLTWGSICMKSNGPVGSSWFGGGRGSTKEDKFHKEAM